MQSLNVWFAALRQFWESSVFLAVTVEIILVLVGAFVAVKGSRVLVARIFSGRLSQYDKSNRIPTLQGLINSVVFYLVGFIVLVMALSRLGVNVASILAAAGVLGLAVGFGAQTLVKDIITGFFIIFENQFAVGEYVLVNDTEGTVEEIGLRTTKIKRGDGALYIVPNGSIAEVVNFCRDNIRVFVDIAVAHGTDVDEAEAVLGQMMAAFAEREREALVEAPSFLGVQALGETSLTLRISAVTKPMHQWQLGRDLRRGAQEALESVGIKSPYADWIAPGRRPGEGGAP